MRTPEQKLATKVNPPVTARLGCSCLNQATTLTIRSGPVWVLAESGRNGSGHCGDATMPRDNPEGSSSRCSAAREVLLSRCRLTGGSHRTIDPMP